MKRLAPLVLVAAAGAAAFFHWGGPEKMGMSQPTNLPDAIKPPNATFVGYEQTNPYAMVTEPTPSTETSHEVSSH